MSLSDRSCCALLCRRSSAATAAQVTIVARPLCQLRRNLAHRALPVGAGAGAGAGAAAAAAAVAVGIHGQAESCLVRGQRGPSQCAAAGADIQAGAGTRVVAGQGLTAPQGRHGQRWQSWRVAARHAARAEARAGTMTARRQGRLEGLRFMAGGRCSLLHLQHRREVRGGALTSRCERAINRRAPSGPVRPACRPAWSSSAAPGGPGRAAPEFLVRGDAADPCYRSSRTQQARSATSSLVSQCSVIAPAAASTGQRH